MQSSKSSEFLNEIADIDLPNNDNNGDKVEISSFNQLKSICGDTQLGKKRIARTKNLKSIKKVTLNDVMRMNEKVSFVEHFEVPINHENWTKRRLMLKVDGNSSSKIFSTYSYSSLDIDESVCQQIESDQQAEREEVEIEKFESFENENSNFFDSGYPNSFGFVSQNSISHGKACFMSSTPLQMSCERKAISLIKSTAINEINRRNGAHVKFSEVYRKTSEALEGQTSCALTFFSILKAANEESIEIITKSDIQDFHMKPCLSRKRLFESDDDVSVIKKIKFN